MARTVAHFFRVAGTVRPRTISDDKQLLRPLGANSRNGSLRLRRSIKNKKAVGGAGILKDFVHLGAMLGKIIGVYGGHSCHHADSPGSRQLVIDENNLLL
jgi:hypothetical protein